MVAIKITGLTFFSYSDKFSRGCVVLTSLSKAVQCLTDQWTQSYWCSCQYMQKTELTLLKQLQKLKYSPAGGNTASWKEK